MKDKFNLDKKTGLLLPNEEVNRLKENKKNKKFEKKFSKSWAKLLIEENKKFEDYFKGLYKDLTYEYNQEIESKNRDEKIEFIQELMDDITRALNNAEHNFSISEIAEGQVSKLKSLRNTFEVRLNDIYFESVSKASSVQEQISEKSIEINSNKIKHPPYDANLFNIKGYELFKYLVENFVEISKRGDKTQFMSIWHYFNNALNNNIEFEKHKGLTKETFKELAKCYGVEITNTDKTASYENKHLTILNSHFEAFESNFSKNSFNKV